jgi:hypothetical protein
MQQKYGERGLVCVSVTIDHLDNWKERSLAFLQKQNATFPNYWLDEEDEVWQERWKIKGPPAIFVFDRDLKRARKFDTDDPANAYTPEDVDKLVQELLR